MAEFGARGDGTSDDTPQFAAALRKYGRVTVPPGVYVVCNLRLESGQSLVGTGGTLKKSGGCSAGVVLTGEGAIVRDLRWETETAGGSPNSLIHLAEGAKNVVIQNNYFDVGAGTARAYSAVDGCRNVGPYYRINVDGVRISNNTFIGASRPLYLHCMDNVTIQGNLFRDTLHDAIRTRINGGNWLVTGNTFLNIGYGVTAPLETRDALDALWAGRRLTITDNIVDRTASQGFDIKGNDEKHTQGVEQVIVSNNQIRNVRASAINVNGLEYPASGLEIFGNILTHNNQSNAAGAGDAGAAAIRVRGNTRHIGISENYIFANYGRGIQIQSGAHDVSVRGNRVINNGAAGSKSSNIGIYIVADGATVTGNTAENDPALENAGVQQFGLYFFSSAGASRGYIVANNTVRNNISSQIFLAPPGSRNNAIAAFWNNIQSGPGVLPWSGQRRMYYASSLPTSADGEFLQGDIIWNTEPGDARPFAGWICVAATCRGKAGEWQKFAPLLNPDLAAAAGPDPGAQVGRPQTVTLSLTGSDGRPCSAVYTKGALTGTTCPTAP